MAGNLWQGPPGAGQNQIYLWAQRLATLLQQGRHKEYHLASVTLTAGTSTTIANTTVTADCRVFLMPSNAAARTLGLPHVSAKAPGTSYTLTHGAAAGTETYDALVIR